WRTGARPFMAASRRKSAKPSHSFMTAQPAQYLAARLTVDPGAAPPKSWRWAVFAIGLFKTRGFENRRRGIPHGAWSSRPDADRAARRTRDLACARGQTQIAIPHRYRAREIRVHARRSSSGGLRRAARHPHAPGRDAASARLGANHGRAEYYRPVRRHRRRRDFARTGRAIRTFRRAARQRPSDIERTDGASGPSGRGGAAAAHRLSRHWQAAEPDPGRNAENAEGPLQDHDRLYAQSRHTRPRHDVSHLHGANQSRLLVRSRHGEKTARID